MFKAIKKRLRAVRYKGSWQTDATSVVYKAAMTNGVYYSSEDAYFAWWGKQTLNCKPKDDSYQTLLQLYANAYAIWQEFLDLKDPALFALKWGKYTWSDLEGGERKVGIRAMAYDGKFLSAYGDGTMRPTASDYSGASEMFRLVPAPGNTTPNAWMVKNAGGSYLNREYSSLNYKFTGRVIFSGNGSTNGLTGYIWYTLPYMGGLALYIPSSPNVYVGILPEGMYCSTTENPITVIPPTGAIRFLDINSPANPEGVAAENIALWNQKVIPTLLSILVNGKSPLVDPGEIGAIARKWESDRTNVDQTMMDQLKLEYCVGHAYASECSCLAARQADPIYAQLKIASPDGCWYKNCSGQFADGKILLTTSIVDERKSCPDVCQSMIQVINSTGVSLKDVQQITTCQIGSQDVISTTDDGDEKKKKLLVLAVAAGGGVTVLLLAGAAGLLLYQNSKK